MGSFFKIKVALTYFVPVLSLLANVALGLEVQAAGHRPRGHVLLQDCLHALTHKPDWVRVAAHNSITLKTKAFSANVAFVMTSQSSTSWLGRLYALEYNHPLLQKSSSEI